MSVLWRLFTATASMHTAETSPINLLLWGCGKRKIRYLYLGDSSFSVTKADTEEVSKQATLHASLLEMSCQPNELWWHAYLLFNAYLRSLLVYFPDRNKWFLCFWERICTLTQIFAVKTIQDITPSLPKRDWQQSWCFPLVSQKYDMSVFLTFLLKNTGNNVWFYSIFLQSTGFMG